jgi:hypothetical protein
MILLTNFYKKRRIIMKSKKIIQIFGIMLLIYFIALAIPPTHQNGGIAQNTDTSLITATPVLGSYITPTGSTNDIEIAGDVLYAADRNGGLRVLNISDPTDPVEIGSYNVSNADNIRALALAGDVLYMTNYSHLISLDVSDPSNPTRIGIVAPGGTNIRDIAIAGDVLYIPKYTSGFDAWSIADPKNPVLLQNVVFTALEARVYGNIAIVVAHDQISIRDVTNPKSMNELANIPLNTTVVGDCGIAFHGDTAYVVRPNSGKQLLAIDISDPSNPTVLFNDTLISGYDIKIAGDLAYVSCGATGLRCFDISDPANPTEVASLDGGSTGSVYDVELAGDVLYTASGNYVRSVRIGEPLSPPIEEASVNTPSTTSQNIAVAGDVAYCGSYAPPYGIYAYDISDPTVAPTLLDSIGIPSWVIDADIEGQVAYFINGTRGLITVDISDPTDLTILGYLQLSFVANVEAITVAGDIAYLGGVGWIISVNVTDPANPVELDSEALSSYHVYDLTAAGNVLYLAADTGGLRCVNITDPTDLHEIGSLPSGTGSVRGVAVAGDVAYLTNTSYLITVDISDPTSPSYLGNLSLTGNPERLAISGDLACLAYGTTDLYTIDISDPRNPKLIGSLDAGAYGYDVAIAGDFAYISGASVDIINVRIRQAGTYDFDSDTLSYIEEVWTYETDPNVDNTPWATGSDDTTLVNSVYNVEWTLYDHVGSGYYRVTSNSSASQDWTPWITNATNGVVADTSTLGTFWYQIEYNNSVGLWGVVDTIYLTVYDNVAPWEGDAPGNPTYEYGEVASDIQWALYDNYDFGDYRVLRDTTTILQDWTSWTTNGTLVTETPNTMLPLGIYNYSVEFTDGTGNIMLDEVFVTLEDTTNPWLVSPPSSGGAEVGSIASFDWLPRDNYLGGYYRVLSNQSGATTGWLSWDNATTIHIVIDTSHPDAYYYTLDFNDSEGLVGSTQTLEYSIADYTPPWDSNPFDPPPLPLNSYYEITWQLYDNYAGGWAQVTSNGTYTGPWVTWVPTTGPSVVVDTTTVGVFSYTIWYNDSVGNPNTDEVIVIVQDNTAPWDNDPADRDVQLEYVEYIQWHLFDNYNPGAGAWGYWRVLSNQTDAVRPWTAWSANNTAISPAIAVNTTIETVWYYTIEYNDSSGNPSTDTVYVRVYKPSKGGIPGFEIIFAFSALIGIVSYQIKKKRIPL